MAEFPRLSRWKTLDQFRQRLRDLKIELPLPAADALPASEILGRPLSAAKPGLGNRFAILPMEGWDGDREGRPSELTFRRWRRFGASGAKLIWGGEAVAVREDGRANPHQLWIRDENLSSLELLRQALVDEHEAVTGSLDQFLVGLQLTHSGRFARPGLDSAPQPRTAYAHPQLESRAGAAAPPDILSDDDLKELIDDFVRAAMLASQIGFDFVDIKHCHGYLGHELLSAVDRPGLFGGSFENRTRFLRDTVAGIRATAPGLEIAVRLSVFDFCPYALQEGVGTPMVPAGKRYPYAFGGDGTGTGIDLTEPHRFLDLLRELGIRLVCTTAGSPYYNPHIQRPAIFPPSDGYPPPEDPLVGVARQMGVTRELKARHPDLILVGSGYSYLQEWLPDVAAAAVEQGWVDVVGLGRMVLSYPELPSDVLNGVRIRRRQICRTFSDCTTAPRRGLVSGCYPLDPFYKQRPEAQQLKQKKERAEE